MFTDSQLVQIVDTALASATLRSGLHLTCHPGCSPCCHGVFEITALDAVRLRAGLDEAAPATAARIRSRLAAAREHLAPFFPGDAATGYLTGTPEEVELFEEWANSDPCPVLNPETHTCDLYAARPILCRTFGPPIRNDHDDAEAGLSICDLNFTQASDEEVAASEMDSSFRPLEEELEAATAGGSTIIAFALI